MVCLSEGPFIAVCYLLMILCELDVVMDEYGLKLELSHSSE